MTISPLLLDSLEIKNFRAFRHLRIKKLGRVNLIGGRNNVGKSCLLEALQLYATRANPSFIWQILEAHDEGVRERLRRPLSERTRRSQNTEEMLSSLKYLFYGRKEITGTFDSIEIGKLYSAEEKLFLSIVFFLVRADEEGTTTFQQASLFDEYTSVENLVPRFSLQIGKNRSFHFPLNPTVSPRLLRLEEITSVFIETGGLGKRRIGDLWDKIALTDHEKDVLSALRLITPGIEGINIVGDTQSIRERFTIIKVAGMSEPLPIRSLGDGMQRVLGIALALVNARDGFLLIDEIENGLHYSTHVDLWRLIFQLALRLNVQVFATSHSWDCIKAFSKVAQEDKESEGVYIRLDYKKENVTAAIYDEETLSVATQQDIEVR